MRRTSSLRSYAAGGAAVALLVMGGAPVLAADQATSSITSNFNGTPIEAGRWIWFSSVVKIKGVGSSPVQISFDDSTVTFDSGGVTYNLAVPNAQLTVDPSALTASTSFVGGTWFTLVPSDTAGNVFLTGFALSVPGGLPGGIKPVTWRGRFGSDTPGVTIQWQWSAAVYSSFDGDLGALAVKPVDDGHASVYANSDHAGTPEAFKTAVVGGARGGGGSNFTGSYSATASVVPGDFHPATGGG